MENTITLNSGQKIEVLFCDEVSLDIDCALRYIKSGEQEINTYVQNMALPHLDNVVAKAQTSMAEQIALGIENASKAATAAAMQEINNAKEEVDIYTQQQIIPELKDVLASAENAAAIAAAKAQDATGDAGKAAGSAENAATKADEAAISADSAKEWAAQAKDIAQNMDNGFNLFDTKWGDHIQNDISWLCSDMFSWHSGEVYTAAYNELQTEYDNKDAVEENKNAITFRRTPKGYKIVTPDQEAAVSAAYSETGIAWYYIIDIQNKRFKLPRIKKEFAGLQNAAGNDEDAMYLYFYIGLYDKPAIKQTAGLNAELFNTKADIDLFNVSQVGKNKAVNWGNPDYDSGISVSQGNFIAPKNGFLVGTAEAVHKSYVYVYKNEVSIMSCYTNSTYANSSTTVMPVAEGELFNIDMGNKSVLNFYPCKED